MSGLFLSAAVLQPGPCAEAVILDVVADAYLQDFASDGLLDGVPETMHDTNALLASTGLLSSGAAVDSRAILVFDVSPYAGMTLSSAALSGFGGRVDNGFLPDPITAHFFGYAGDGSITLADFDRAATAAGSVNLPGVTQFPFNLAAFSVPVSPVVQPLLAGSLPYLEFRVEADALSAYLNAFNATDPRFTGPRLALEFEEPQSEPPRGVVPEPSSLWLFSSALGMLALRPARRRVE
jgi:hypothetical protein